jgi:hypothetical protein
MEFPQKVKIDLPYESAILMSICLMEYKSVYKGHTCTCIFIVTLLTIEKLWNQLRLPITNE